MSLFIAILILNYINADPLTYFFAVVIWGAHVVFHWD